MIVYFFREKELNEEVEIIEDTPKVQVEMTEKEYFKYLDRRIDERLSVPKEDKKIEKMDFCYKVADEMQNANNERFRDFINEIIEKVNGEDNE